MLVKPRFYVGLIHIITCNYTQLLCVITYGSKPPSLWFVVEKKNRFDSLETDADEIKICRLECSFTHLSHLNIEYFHVLH